MILVMGYCLMRCCQIDDPWIKYQTVALPSQYLDFGVFLLVATVERVGQRKRGGNIFWQHANVVLVTFYCRYYRQRFTVVIDIKTFSSSGDEIFFSIL